MRCFAGRISLAGGEGPRPTAIGVVGREYFGVDLFVDGVMIEEGTSNWFRASWAS